MGFLTPDNKGDDDVTGGIDDVDLRNVLRQTYTPTKTQSGEPFPRDQMREARLYTAEQNPPGAEDQLGRIGRDIRQISREAALEKGAGDTEMFHDMKRIGDIARNQRRDYQRGANLGRAIDRTYGR
jgi:hypothetical protein